MFTNQASRALLMIRPVSFQFDEQTAVSNAFQQRISQKNVCEQALQEFDTAVATLRDYDIDVMVFEDEPTPEKPNAVFPNNWLSTWPDGTVYLYPMATASRRIERTPAVLELLRTRYSITSVEDISAWEYDSIYLESTGVMVFDHLNKRVYGCISPRCDEDLFIQHVTKDLDYTPITFHANDKNGQAIYHTNVLMGIQSKTAVICLEAITDKLQRQDVKNSLKAGGRTVIEISHEQMNSFCGNVLEVENIHGERFVVMSQTAYNNFTPKQRETLSKHAQIIPIAIPTIETVGGGSARCMLAEIFLPKR